MAVHSSLEYKNAVKAVYERALVEARTKAQEDPQYLLRGDVSRSYFGKQPLLLTFYALAVVQPFFVVYIIFQLVVFLLLSNIRSMVIAQDKQHLFIM